MKLVGIRHRGHVWIAVQLDGTVSPIAEVDDFYSDLHRHLDQARGLTHGELPTSDVVLAPPVPASARVICVGLNYRAHAAEGRFEVPLHPAIFGRWTASLTVSGTPAPVNANEPGLDWEGEVAAIVGARLTDVDPERGRRRRDGLCGVQRSHLAPGAEADAPVDARQERRPQRPDRADRHGRRGRRSVGGTADPDARRTAPSCRTAIRAT